MNHRYDPPLVAKEFTHHSLTHYTARIQSGSLCGRHSINNLLQGPYVNEIDLAGIASELDTAERTLMMSEGTDTTDALRYLQEESFNVDDSGNFSLTVRIILDTLFVLLSAHPDLQLIGVARGSSTFAWHCI